MIRTELVFDIFILGFAIVCIAIIAMCLLACYLFIQDDDFDEHEEIDNSRG